MYPKPPFTPPAGPAKSPQRLVIEFSPAVERALVRIADALNGLNFEGVTMSQMDSLVAEVSRNTTVVSSALAVIKGLQEQLAAAGTDAAALASLQASIKANSDALAAAVVANTPAASAPVAPAPVSTADAGANPASTSTASVAASAAGAPAASAPASTDPNAASAPAPSAPASGAASS